MGGACLVFIRTPWGATCAWDRRAPSVKPHCGQPPAAWRAWLPPGVSALAPGVCALAPGVCALPPRVPEPLSPRAPSFRPHVQPPPSWQPLHAPRPLFSRPRCAERSSCACVEAFSMCQMLPPPFGTPRQQRLWLVSFSSRTFVELVREHSPFVPQPVPG